MKLSARVRVTVNFARVARPDGYLVRMIPEGGEAIGKWSGSGDIDAKDQITFEDFPPGRYLFQGQPNPSDGDRIAGPVAVELKDGTTEVA